MSLPSINFLHVTVSEIQAGQNFPAARPDTMGENNTPTALKGCGVKTVALSLRPLEYASGESFHNGDVSKCTINTKINTFKPFTVTSFFSQKCSMCANYQHKT